MTGRARGRERGQGLVEYALLIALVAIVVVGAAFLLGRSLYTVFYGIAEALQFGCGMVSAETFRSYAGEGGTAPAGPIAPDYFPTQGTITQGYWFCHKGLDIANDEGTAVRAVAAGTVKFAGWSDKGYGYMVVIDHGSYQTLYAHLKQSPSVSTGQSVAAGTSIGLMGNTGFSTGPHLHFEIRLGRDLVDPAMYFP
jgi:murein DD-endopeptidase MepM/ murein hydrolase activator NlpD